jgi:hypothetical protein
VQSCCVPANILCFKVLAILRDHGLIYGYSHLYTRRRLRHGFYHGYPRVKINFKYTDVNLPVLKDIKVFKNTKSIFYLFNNRRNNFRIFSDHKFYLLTNSKGLLLTSFPGLQTNHISSEGKNLSGKVLLEVSV